MNKGERIIPGNGAGVRERLGWANSPTGWTSGGDVSKLLRLEKMPGGPVVRPLSRSGPRGSSALGGKHGRGVQPEWEAGCNSKWTGRLTRFYRDSRGMPGSGDRDMDLTKLEWISRM